MAGRFFASKIIIYLTRSILILPITSSIAYGADSLYSGLTLPGAILLSLNNHPELDSFKYKMQSAEGEIKYSAIREKPELSLSVEDAFGTGSYKNFDSAETTLSISWILDNDLADRRVGKFKTKKMLIDIEQNIKRLDIAAVTAHRFLTVIALQDRLAIAEKAKRHSHTILKDISKRVKSGNSPIADQLRAEVSVERRELEIEDITHELLSSKRILASMWGETTISLTPVFGTLTLSQTLIDYEELEEAIKNSPRIEYYLTKQRLAESEISLANEEAKNRLRFNAGVRRYEQFGDYGLTFGVSLPLGKANRNTGRISSLSADKSRYEVNANAEKIEMMTEVFVLYEELKHSHHITESLENNILPRLELALKETYKAYQLGKYTYQEWSIVQQEVLDAQLALIDSRLTAYNNTIELERLTALNLSNSRVLP